MSKDKSNSIPAVVRRKESSILDFDIPVLRNNKNQFEIKFLSEVSVIKP